MTSLAAALAPTLPCSKLLWEVNQIIVTHSSRDLFSAKLGTKTDPFHIHIGDSNTASYHWQPEQKLSSATAEPYPGCATACAVLHLILFLLP